jgi:hypothetical protein
VNALVSVDHNSMAAHHTRIQWKGFTKCCMSSAVEGPMMMCCGMTMERMELLEVSVRMETVKLIGKGR